MLLIKKQTNNKTKQSRTKQYKKERKNLIVYIILFLVCVYCFFCGVCVCVQFVCLFVFLFGFCLFFLFLFVFVKFVCMLTCLIFKRVCGMLFLCPFAGSTLCSSNMLNGRWCISGEVWLVQHYVIFFALEIFSTNLHSKITIRYLIKYPIAQSAYWSSSASLKYLVHRYIGVPKRTPTG